MAFKRKAEPATIEDEREALRAQHAALEDLKRQLAERIGAVREREVELHHALADIENPARSAPAPFDAPPVLPAPIVADADTGAEALEAARREKDLADRERAITEREAAVDRRAREIESRASELESSVPRAAAPVDAPQVLAIPIVADADTGEDALEAARREKDLADRERAITEREEAIDRRAREIESRASELEARSAREVAAAPVEATDDASAARLTQIEGRLAELRDAEALFLRTRDELAARSEAVAARERLVGQRERELDAREDAEADRSAAPGFSEMEARLRRLEQQQRQPDPREQTLGFSSGLRKLEQGSRQRPS